MKRKEFVKVKELTLKELKGKLKSLQNEIANLQLDKNMKKLKDLKMVSKKRKELAQLLTVAGQKEMLRELELRVSVASENSDSEKIKRSKDQNTGISGSQTAGLSDSSGIPSSSELSENKKSHAKRRTKK